MTDTKTLQNIPINNTPKKRKRILWMDILRGFMMYLVIFGHTSTNKPLVHYIYSFHMPMFFILSGMTFQFNKEWNTGRFIRKKFEGLMIPYVLLSIYVAPLREWLERIGECSTQTWKDLILGTLYSNSNTGYKMASNTNWFIPCLFLTVIIFFLVDKLAIGLNRYVGSKSSQRISTAEPPGGHATTSRVRQFLSDCISWSDCIAIMLTVLLILFAKALGLNHGTSGIWHWRTAIFATGFYLVGYLLLPMVSKVEFRKPRHYAYAILAAALLFYAGYELSVKNGFVSMIRNEYKHLGIYYVSAIMTCVAWILIFMVLSESKRFLRYTGFMNTVGVHTLPYIAFQVPVMKLLTYYVPFFNEHVEPATTILCLLLYFGLIPVAIFIDRLIPRKLSLARKK